MKYKIWILVPYKMAFIIWWNTWPCI